MKKHKTKSISLKRINVDIKIIPIVDWLNSFDSVFTKFSCEGGKHKPYIVFSCDSSRDLFEITRRVGTYGVVSIRPALDIRLMDFYIEFESKKDLKYFVEVLNMV